MNVLLAPDKFKGSLTARQAVDAMAAGVRAACPAAVIDACPLADGGEGMVDAVISAAGGRVDWHDVCGPLPGTRVRAPIGWLPDGRTAVIELAAASGLELLPREQRDPTRTTTFGTGELIAIAVAGGATRIVVGVGGSATCDGGLGIAQACGGAIRLRSGKTYASADRKLTGADTGRVLSIGRRTDAKAISAPLRYAGVKIVVAADVGNPLLGPDGAATVFAPQKGATAAQVKKLEEGLTRLAERLAMTDVAAMPAAGAGGGAAFGLMAFFGATAVSGATFVFEHLDFAVRVRRADLCLTGEGRFDPQSLGGKAPVAVARACRDAGVPCVVLAGTLGDGWAAAHEEGVTAAVSILNRPMALVEASEHAARLLTTTTEQVVRLWTCRAGPKRT